MDAGNERGGGDSMTPIQLRGVADKSMGEARPEPGSQGTSRLRLLFSRMSEDPDESFLESISRGGVGEAGVLSVSVESERHLRTRILESFLSVLSKRMSRRAILCTSRVGKVAAPRFAATSSACTHACSEPTLAP
eukprot:scaffold287725_cov28-Tisochrysis_lutea.AAC.3